MAVGEDEYNKVKLVGGEGEGAEKDEGVRIKWMKKIVYAGDGEARHNAGTNSE